MWHERVPRPRPSLKHLPYTSECRYRFLAAGSILARWIFQTLTVIEELEGVLPRIVEIDISFAHHSLVPCLSSAKGQSSHVPIPKPEVYAQTPRLLKVSTCLFFQYPLSQPHAAALQLLKALNLSPNLSSLSSSAGCCKFPCGVFPASISCESSTPASSAT